MSPFVLVLQKSVETRTATLCYQFVTGYVVGASGWQVSKHASKGRMERQMRRKKEPFTVHAYCAYVDALAPRLPHGASAHMATVSSGA